MAQNEIRDLVEQFAAQIEAMAKRSALEQVVASLGASVGARADAPTKRGPGRPKGSKNAASAPAASAAPTARGATIVKVRKGRRRSAEDVGAMGDTLLAHVKANPGQRGEQIAAALKSDVGTIRLPMKALIAAKKITTRGQRRGMQYFAAGTAPKGPAPKPAKKAAKAKKS